MLSFNGLESSINSLEHKGQGLGQGRGCPGHDIDGPKPDVGILGPTSMRLGGGAWEVGTSTKVLDSASMYLGLASIDLDWGAFEN